MEAETANRLEERVAAWGVTVERTVETGRSIVAFGTRDNRPVVVKVIAADGDEWRSGDVLAAFEGEGVARIYERADGALLLERIAPGDALAPISVGGDDQRATTILAGVMARMSPGAAPRGVPTVHDWLAGFERHLSSGDSRIPRSLVHEAHRIYAGLCDSQSRPRLLHGDLHHYNVLLDANRGWLAIDPKGVVGEPEFEVGAALRNPCERPELFSDPATIRDRVAIFARELGLDARRMVAWGFAQAALSAIWSVEDGEDVDRGHSAVVLAQVIRPMLEG